jgi:hypothetical protein
VATFEIYIYIKYIELHIYVGFVYIHTLLYICILYIVYIYVYTLEFVYTHIEPIANIMIIAKG